MHTVLRDNWSIKTTWPYEFRKIFMDEKLFFILSVTIVLYCRKTFVIQINRLCWILFDDARQRNVFSCSTISRFAREQNGIRKWSFRVKMSKWRSSANSDERKTILGLTKFALSIFSTPLPFWNFEARRYFTHTWFLRHQMTYE